MPAAMKRPAAAKKAAVPKKAKIDPHQTKCTQALKQLHHHAPEGVVLMLEEMLPLAAVQPQMMRDKYQASVVKMTEDLMMAHESLLKQALEEAEDAVKHCEASAAAKEAAADAAMATVSAKMEVMQAQKLGLAEAAGAFRSAKARLQEAEEDLEVFMKDLREAATKKEKLETAQKEQLMPLSEGTNDKEMIDGLVKVLQSFLFDSSMTIAIPNAFGKPIEERGAFDTMVIAQVTQEIATKIGEFTSTLTEGDPGKQAREAKLERLKDALSQARDLQLNKYNIFSAAKAEHESAGDALSEANKAVKATGPERRAAAKAVGTCKKNLTTFREKNLAVFIGLRDLAPPPVEPEEPVEETAPAAEDNAEVAVEAE